ncbi:MAG: hypothetical protein J6M06_02710 [Synergistaceae bacterium]|nr:hypothetical protein [Synergistaceae bacterium]
MAAFWCVNSKFLVSGKVRISVYPIDAEVKPERITEPGATCVTCYDYFDTNKEAWAFAEKVKKA